MIILLILLSKAGYPESLSYLLPPFLKSR